LRLWAKDSPEALAVREKYKSDPSDKSDPSAPSDPYRLRTAPAEVAANTIICLINQASYLLGRQLQKLEQSFLQDGGFSERLYRERSRRRDKPSSSDPSK
jgi:four helix bundle suffix protein